MNKLLAFFALIAGIASAQSHIRTFELVTDNTTFPTPANVSWMQGESPKFSITAKYGNYYVAFSNGAAPVLKMWSGSVVTQLYAIKTGSVYNASNGKLTVELAANEANIQPTGEYNYAVGVYDGTNYMGIVAQGKATVKAHPFGASVGYVGTSSLFNFVPTNEAPVTNAYIAGSSGTGNVAKVGRRLAITFPAGGGGSGTFTNLVWNGNANTAQAIVLGESNVVLRYTGGTSYVGLASSITGDLTFNGAINANDHIEIANTKHLRFQDGGGTNTVHLEAVKGRLIITGAVDIVSAQAVPATINGGAIATGTPLYVQSETNAAARLSSNVWALADSTTNYVAKNTLFDSTGALNYQSDGSSFTVYSLGAGGIGLYGNTTNWGFFRATGYIQSDGASGFIGIGGGLTGLDSGALTNLGSGLTLSGGKLTTTNGLAQILANGGNAAGQSATNFSTVQAAVNFIGNGAGLTNLNFAFTNALLSQVSITDGAGGTNLVVVSNSSARLYFQRASNVAFFGFTGYATNAAFAISVECAPSATSFAFDPAISNRIAVVFNATNATLFQARKNRSESWVSVKQQ